MAAPYTITAENFETEVLQAEEPVLVDFWAPWCGPCRVIGPLVEELTAQYAEKLKVGKLNVDDHPSIAQQYGITGIPALLFFKGGTVIDTVVGAVPKNVLQQHVDQAVDGASTTAVASKTHPSQEHHFLLAASRLVSRR